MLFSCANLGSWETRPSGRVAVIYTPGTPGSTRVVGEGSESSVGVRVRRPQRTTTRKLDLDISLSGEKNLQNPKERVGEGQR